MPVMCATKTTMSDSQKQRRSNKPLMERKRRERINQCLNELKTLVLTAQKKDPSRYSKLEKADILEMTVRHVQNLQNQDASRLPGDQTAKYKAGFTQCASEVNRFLASVSGLPCDLVEKVLTHLNASISNETKKDIASVNGTFIPGTVCSTSGSHSTTGRTTVPMQSMPKTNNVAYLISSALPKTLHSSLVTSTSHCSSTAPSTTCAADIKIMPYRISHHTLRPISPVIATPPVVYTCSSYIPHIATGVVTTCNPDIPAANKSPQTAYGLPDSPESAKLSQDMSGSPQYNGQLCQESFDSKDQLHSSFEEQDTPLNLAVSHRYREKLKEEDLLCGPSNELRQMQSCLPKENSNRYMPYPQGLPCPRSSHWRPWGGDDQR